MSKTMEKVIEEMNNCKYDMAMMQSEFDAFMTDTRIHIDNATSIADLMSVYERVRTNRHSSWCMKDLMLIFIQRSYDLGRKSVHDTIDEMKELLKIDIYGNTTD